jgi:hypothetical protein
MPEPPGLTSARTGPVPTPSPAGFRWREVAAVLALALVITLVLAAPVLQAPSERLFGREIVGRNHDPFTVMEQFGRPLTLGVYSQPVTDLTGALLARVMSPVVAYNWLILLSFPLSAVLAYLLARHLTLFPAGAAVAALAYAFSPFHLAHAAYHPHIAQTQWIPLYLLAVWRCLDDSRPAAVGLLIGATAAVTLSNFYGGFIAAVMTPVALFGYWLARRGTRPGATRRLLVTGGALLLMAGAGLVYLKVAAPAVLTDPASFAFRRNDLLRYSATWWSYLVPPLGHPFLGGLARRIWEGSGVGGGVLEKQVYLGWGILALGVFAGFRWLTSDRRTAAIAWMPLLAMVSFTAILCSLSPERKIGGFTITRPSGLLYSILPMFRCYARFGVIVQLMAALAAGIGVDRLLRYNSRLARAACAALLLVAGAEYMVWPPDLWRDVLPSAAHRFVMRLPGRVRALDCVNPSPAEASVTWLTSGRISFPSGALGDCAEPGFPDKLTAFGYTHLLVRRDSAAGRRYENRGVPEGLTSAARFEDGEVFTVTAPAREGRLRPLPTGTEDRLRTAPGGAP